MSYTARERTVSREGKGVEVVDRLSSCVINLGVFAEVVNTTAAGNSTGVKAAFALAAAAAGAACSFCIKHRIFPFFVCRMIRLSTFYACTQFWLPASIISLDILAPGRFKRSEVFDLADRLGDSLVHNRGSAFVGVIINRSVGAQSICPS